MLFQKATEIAKNQYKYRSKYECLDIKRKKKKTFSKLRQLRLHSEAEGRGVGPVHVSSWQLLG